MLSHGVLKIQGDIAVSTSMNGLMSNNTRLLQKLFCTISRLGESLKTHCLALQGGWGVHSATCLNGYTIFTVYHQCTTRTRTHTHTRTHTLSAREITRQPRDRVMLRGAYAALHAELNKHVYSPRLPRHKETAGRVWVIFRAALLGKNEKYINETGKCWAVYKGLSKSRWITKR